MIHVSYRHVCITNPASVSVKNGQLTIHQEEEYSIPLEDISTVVLESNRVRISSVALSKIADYGIALFTCNHKHLPNGVLIPFNAHSRQLKVLNTQLTIKKSFQKRVWQKIIRQKIENEAKCLKYCGVEGAEKLERLIDKVESGDRTYIEAEAARLYFIYLFGKSFHRRQDDTLNAALNYGYALLRGAIARTLSTYGFMPCKGLFHHSELNNFNLADDFLEPYRSLVDLWAMKNLNIEQDGLNSRHKRGLNNLFNAEIQINNGKYSITSSIEIMISSFVNALANEQFELLKLPVLLPLEQEKHD